MQAAAADGPSMEGGVVGCHRAVPDRHLPIALQLTLNSAAGLAMLQLQMECDRTLDLCLHLSAEGEHSTAPILVAFAASYRHLRV